MNVCPWARGLAAEVFVLLPPESATTDPRYNDDVDKIAGYTTDSLLCLPIKNTDEEIIGVAQVINKRTDVGHAYFLRDDEKLLETYLTFCGMAISNAQAMESYTREYDRNRALLEVVHDVFEEQTSVENIVSKIMLRAQTLLKCDRCIVMLRDRDSMDEKSGFSRVFDLHQPMRNGHIRNGESKIADKYHTNKIAEIVASTGETVNIADAQQDPRIGKKKEDNSAFQIKSILCKPIRNADLQIIGVAQLINKLNDSPFDEHDDQLFEAFTIFCGLGINNCLLYDEVSKSAAKQAVAIEVLSYHATVPTDEIDKLKSKPIPSTAELKLDFLDFNDFALSSDEMVIGAIRIFKHCGFLKSFRIDYETMIRWLLTVKKNYRNIAYHNWRHAFNVCQVMFALLHKCNMKTHLDEMEMLALVSGCLCHDLDHRGTNNAFQQKSSSALSQLYGTKATLEHHHFNHAIMILNSEGHNIFSNLSSEDYSHVMNLLKHAILATDLSKHIQVRKKFFPLIESGLFNFDDPEQRELLRSALMTTCDIASICKPWEVQRKVADLVVSEFFEQGDKEKMLKIQPQALMDREKKDELPSLQIGWIDGICLPLYKSLARMDSVFEPMLERVLENRKQWELMNLRRITMGTSKETDV